MWFVGAPVSFDGGFREPFPADAAIVPTRPGDRHLTLAYLGRVPLDSVLSFWRALPQLALPESLRPLRWERFGRNAIALSFADDEGRVRTATDACFDVAEKRLPELRRPSELRVHVTLGRVRRGAARPPATAMRAWPVPPAPLGVGPPTLFRTTDDQAGDRYEVVEQQLGESGERADVGR